MNVGGECFPARTMLQPSFTNQRQLTSKWLAAQMRGRLEQRVVDYKGERAVLHTQLQVPLSSEQGTISILERNCHIRAVFGNPHPIPYTPHPENQGQNLAVTVLYVPMDCTEERAVLHTQLQVPLLSQHATT